MRDSAQKMPETKYKLVEKETDQVSYFWKGFHLALLATISVTGFLAAYVFGNSLLYFGENCILYPEISFIPEGNLTELDTSNQKIIPNEELQLDLMRTRWGTISNCSFCQFTPIISMIFGVVWCTFFCLCSKGGRGNTSDLFIQPWSIVYPALVMAAFTFVLMLVDTQILSKGIQSFCSQFKPIYNSTECANRIDEYTLTFNKYQKPLMQNLYLAPIFAYINLAAWFLQMCFLVLRILCIVDFEPPGVHIKDETEAEVSV